MTSQEKYTLLFLGTGIVYAIAAIGRRVANIMVSVKYDFHIHQFFPVYHSRLPVALTGHDDVLVILLL